MELGEILDELNLFQSDEQIHRKAFNFLINESRNNESFNSVYDHNLTQVIEILLDARLVVHPRISTMAARQLYCKYGDSEIDRDLLFTLGQDRLLLILLRSDFNRDIQFEPFLKLVRKKLLEVYTSKGRVDENILQLTAAMAIQCFYNEYLFDESAVEIDRIKELESYSALRKVNEYALMTLAMYRPLYKSGDKWDLKIEIQNSIVIEAFNVIWFQPRHEYNLRSDIRSIAELSDKVSIHVRDQYEQNPYPRWVNLATKEAIPIKQLIRLYNPDLKWPADFNKGAIRILVAGCGTGKQAIQMAKANPEAEITAVDISLGSLSYAKRMADVHEVQNLRFVHGDILELSSLKMRFHHVECVGVVHHMADQKKAWEALRALVLPGGTLHLAIYSTMARMPVNSIKRLIKDYLPCEEIVKMKEVRRKIMEEVQFAPHRNYLLVPDFFTMSMFRDLLFHVEEYQYTLRDVENLIQSTKMNFLAFDLPKTVLKKYKELFPKSTDMTDFKNYKTMEKYYTASLEMFRFWLQVPV